MEHDSYAKRSSLKKKIAVRSVFCQRARAADTMGREKMNCVVFDFGGVVERC